MVHATCLKEGGKFYPIDKVVMHPKFEDGSHGNDIALVRITGEMDFKQDRVGKIALAYQEIPDNVEATFTSWYHLDVSDIPSVCFSISQIQEGRN